MRRFSSWLAEEGEIPADPFLGVKSPKLDERVVDPLSDYELRAMLKACIPAKGATPAEALRHRRDEAMIRLMLESGMRAGEVVALHIDDVDLAGGVATVRRGKGGNGRVVPFGPEVALALDRYLRLRRSHRLADRTDLWLGDRGKGFSYDALHKSLAMRADQGGVVGFHPHRLLIRAVAKRLPDKGDWQNAHQLRTLARRLELDDQQKRVALLDEWRRPRPQPVPVGEPSLTGNCRCGAPLEMRTMKRGRPRKHCLTCTPPR